MPNLQKTPTRARDLQVGQRILNRRTAEAWLIVKVEDVPGPRAFVKLTLESGEVVRRDRGDLFTVVPT